MHLVAFDAYQFAAGLLADLQHEKLRLGIISNTGNDGKTTVNSVLKAAGILDYFDPDLRLYSHDIGLTKDFASDLQSGRGTRRVRCITPALPVRRGERG